MQRAVHTAIFTYEGEASAVRLRTFMPRFDAATEFEWTGDRWELALDLPNDARIEYRLDVTSDHRSRLILDPANPATANNPFGTNSVYTGPDYADRHWSGGGTTAEVRVQSDALGGRRHHILHSPEGSSPEDRLPLLIVHDGSDYVRFAGLLTCLAGLRLRAAVPVVRVLGLNPRERHVHYIASERHVAHVVDEALPHVKARVAVGDRILMGSSLGAVAAWHTAWSHPGLFRGLFLQSGTFALAPHPELTASMFESINRFMRAALEDPRTNDLHVAQTCGRWESLIDWNRTVRDTLARHSKRHAYRETWTGHDWGAWSGSLEFGLAVALEGVEP